MARQKVILTYTDYLKLPDDGTRKEILGGELFVTPAPTPRHQHIVRKLATVLGTHVDTHGLGDVLAAPIDVVLSPPEVTQPDLIFIATPNLGIIGEAAIHGAPDLVVEVLSPSTAVLDRGRKKDTYARAGVPEYWIVDPEARTIEVYRLERETHRLAERVEHDAWQPGPFAGLTVQVDRLWDR